MTCNACIGYKFCSRGRNGQTNFYGKEIACNNVEYLCHDFTNKADYEEVKHGYWKDRYGNKYDNHLYECSVCGKKALYEVYGNELGQTNIRQALTVNCPHCGAKMDVERNEVRISESD